MSGGALASELERRARAEGFDAIGIAPAERPHRDADALRAWLGDGYHASMVWMERDPERRADPRALLAGCRSVVALAMNYYPGEAAARTPEGRAAVALYARSRDYHRVLGPRARRLAAWLEQASGRPARAFVDTAPVLERAWAERAGIGWIGKNACLLSRQAGSWWLLAEILSAADLGAVDRAPEEFCGSCTACLEACPTGALVAPAVLDSNRCIAYWTIEHRGPIPEAVRPAIGEWIFGCDVCQDVCPWNGKAARPASPSPLEARADLAGLDAVEVLETDETTFRARFSGTPLMRAKWEGMRRNACVVLGNVGGARAVAALERALDDADPVVRSHAAWALARIDPSPQGENEAKTRRGTP